MDFAQELTNRGFSEWTEAGDPAGLRVWVSDVEDMARAVARHHAVRAQLGSSGGSVFLATEASDVPENFALGDRVRAFLNARGSALESLPTPPWLDEALRALSESVVETALKRARRKDRGDDADVERKPPARLVGEGDVRVVVHDGESPWGPLPVGWLFAPSRSAALAALWEKWAAFVGFYPLIVGARSLEARAPRLPSDAATARDLARDALIVCPELAEGDRPPAVAALDLVLSTRWSFAWD